MVTTLLSDVDRYLILLGKEQEKRTRLKKLLLLCSPRLMPVFLVRLSLSCIPVISKLISLMNVVVFGLEVNTKCKIESGLFFPHTVGSVIGARKIGCNCTIFQGVTIGAKELDFSNSKEKRPSIGDDVIIGAGAKILGNIHIGNNVTIGANSVVTKSIPDDCTVVGNPSRIIGLENDG
ncbi:serine O-acetyltransferase [Vibrio sp. F74]|uniref:serine O-acetyltransferase n=1 Tax=Vibrio sp. F74 TaxID=700020 RepID=UPI0035F5F0B8